MRPIQVSEVGGLQPPGGGQHVLAMRAIERPVGASRGIAGDYSRAQGRGGTRTVQFKSTYF